MQIILKITIFIWIKLVSIKVAVKFWFVFEEYYLLPRTYWKFLLIYYFVEANLHIYLFAYYANYIHYIDLKL